MFLSLEVVAMIKRTGRNRPKLKEFVERIRQAPSTNTRSSVENEIFFPEPIEARNSIDINPDSHKEHS